MPPKIIYERFLWFDGQIKGGKYPNATDLAQKFEMSRKTAQRDIDFMRDRLKAPLYYMAGPRGYEYDDSTYSLPGIWLNEEELGALFIAFRLASTIPDKDLKSSLMSFLQQIVSVHNEPKKELTFNRLVASIRQIHDQMAAQAGKAVNISLTLRNWAIGFYIQEYEQNGADRAKYGQQISSLYYERSGLSKDKKKLAELVKAGAESAEPKLTIRDPYISESLGLNRRRSWVHSPWPEWTTPFSFPATRSSCLKRKICNASCKKQSRILAMESDYP